MLICRARSAAQRKICRTVGVVALVWGLATVLPWGGSTALFVRPAQARDAKPAQPDDRRDLAERMSQLAKAVTIDRPLVPAVLRQSAALLEAAAVENPVPRYYRILASNYQQLGDSDKELAALTTYYRFPADQNSEGAGDEIAIIRLIDLHLQRMQSLDDKLKYVNAMAGVDKLTGDVRSHAEFIACRLYDQRLDTEKAKAALDKALELNPLNIEALRYRYGKILDNGTPSDVVGALLDLLRANPVQPEVMSTLADQLVQQGLPDAAVNWYTNSFQLNTKLNIANTPEVFLNYACALYTTQQADRAADAAGQLLKSDPSNTHAAFLRLLIARQRGLKKAIDDANSGVVDAIAQRLSALHGSVIGQAPATRPADDEVNDAAADLAKIRAAGDDSLFATYIGAIEDLATFKIYFSGQTAAAQPLLATLEQFLPAADVAIARLEGFSKLNDKKYDEAAVKFSAVADRDALAKMGMILVDLAKGKDTSKLSARATDLLTANQGGLLTLILQDGLRPLNVAPNPTDYTDAIHKQLNQFPHDWLNILDHDSTQDFYNMKAEPIRIEHAVGEPFLVRLTIQCTSEFPITLGSDSTLRRDVFIDCHTRGLFNAPFPSVYDQIAGPIVLRKGEMGVNQIIRVDDPTIDQLLNQNTVTEMPLFYSFFTNPVTMSTGIVPGPAGYRRDFADAMLRVSNPLNDPAQKADLERKLTQGTIDQQMDTLDLLVTYVINGRNQITQAQANPNPAGGQPQLDVKGFQSAIDDYSLWVHNAERNDSPAVKAWAGYCNVLCAQDPAKLAAIKQLAAKPGWQDRILATALLHNQPADQAKKIAQQIADAAQAAQAAANKQIAAKVEPANGQDPPQDVAKHEGLVLAAAQTAIEAADVAPSTQPAQPPTPTADSSMPPESPEETPLPPPNQSPSAPSGSTTPPADANTPQPLPPPPTPGG
jgi:tetratricopeptide (TPR) repeat protein